MTKLEQALACLTKLGYKAEIDGSDIYVAVGADYMERISQSEIMRYAKEYLDDEMAEKNVTIAEFMGAVGTPMYDPIEWDIYVTGHLDVDSDHENAQHFYRGNEMRYHYSWDWLMPAVEKCLTTNETAGGQHALINDALLTCNINVIHDAVVNFIFKNKLCV